jgi:Protein of unknown function (DUF3179)
VYDREIAGRTLTFGNTGGLYRNSLVMYDHETNSLWSHLLGAAVKGPLKGTRLRFIPSTFTSWAEWRRDHPRTLALSPEHYSYIGAELTYTSYFSSGQTGVLPTARTDPRLPSKALVLGVLAPEAKAYPIAALAKRGTIHDTLAGHGVEIRFDQPSGGAAAFLAEGGRLRRLPSTLIFWFAWVDLISRAPLWTPPHGG